MKLARIKQEKIRSKSAGAMMNKKKNGSGGGSGRGAGRGYGRYGQNSGRGRWKDGGYHSERTGYEADDMELLKQCGYDFGAFTAARDEARKKTNESQIPPDGFNQSNPPPTESELTEEVNERGKIEGGTSKGGEPRTNQAKRKSKRKMHHPT